MSLLPKFDVPAELKIILSCGIFSSGPSPSLLAMESYSLRSSGPTPGSAGSGVLVSSPLSFQSAVVKGSAVTAFEVRRNLSLKGTSLWYR